MSSNPLGAVIISVLPFSDNVGLHSDAYRLVMILHHSAFGRNAFFQLPDPEGLYVLDVRCICKTRNSTASEAEASLLPICE